MGFKTTNTIAKYLKPKKKKKLIYTMAVVSTNMLVKTDPRDIHVRLGTLSNLATQTQTGYQN